VRGKRKKKAQNKKEKNNRKETDKLERNKVRCRNRKFVDLFITLL
jgi:hypothetical protein